MASRDISPTVHGALPGRALRLPLNFAEAALAEDLAKLRGEDWTAHFVPQNYSGDWSVVPLRAPAGAAHPILRIAANPGGEWIDTEYLEAMPAFRTALASFAAPVMAARLMRLAPGSRIREHSDPELDPEQGSVRLHIPVTTNPQVDFRVGGERIEMNPGECWFLRLTLPHSVTNRGGTDRIHLVVDLTVNAWLEGLLKGGAA